MPGAFNLPAQAWGSFLFVLSSEKPPTLWLHGLMLALPLALLAPALRGLETPLPDGIYRAVRGYDSGYEGCPRRIEVSGVKITLGTISFESGDVTWRGMIDSESGMIRIESEGV